MKIDDGTLTFFYFILRKTFVFNFRRHGPHDPYSLKHNIRNWTMALNMICTKKNKNKNVYIVFLYIFHRPTTMMSFFENVRQIITAQQCKVLVHRNQT